MRYGFIVPKGDPSTVAVLAREAEEAGWDGIFYYVTTTPSVSARWRPTTRGS